MKTRLLRGTPARRPRVPVGLALLAMVLLLGQFVSAQRLAPLNPEFVQYQQQTTRSAPMTKSGHRLGWTPPPMLRPNIAHRPARAPLPATYDLRTMRKLTAVRDQSYSGSCWAHATYASLESNLLPGETWDFAENNLKNRHGFDYDPNTGGGHTWMSMAYLGRWEGPVAETDDPYDPASVTSPPRTPRKHAQDVIWLPDRTTDLDNTIFKQAVVDHGAVYVAYLHDDTFFSDTYDSYYNNTTTTGGGHAVAIVGWDDNFPASKFKNTPPGNGAFIVRNSWGAYWGENGYYYVSYYDKKFGRRNDNAVFLPAESTTNYAQCYLYDPLGAVTGYSPAATSTGWAANIFTANATEDLTAVSTYAFVPSTSYELFIYLNPTSGPLNSGGAAWHQTGTMTDAGYHTIKLTSPVGLTSGAKFSVVVKLTSPGFYYPIPVEVPQSGYSSAATASRGQSWSSSNGTSWTDYQDLPALVKGNASIKAFTAASASTPLTGVTLTCTPPSGQFVGTTVTLTATPAGGTNPQYRFELSGDNGMTWESLQNYDDVNNCSWTPNAVATYQLRVLARNSATSPVVTSPTVPYLVKGVITTNPLANLTVNENGIATCKVALSAKPLANATVTCKLATGGDPSLVVVTGSLTFTPTNWNTAQDVTLRALKDDDAEFGHATLQMTALNYQGADVSVTISDTDQKQVLASPTMLSVAENGTGTFKVWLAAQPLSDTVVTTTPQADSDPDLGITGGGSLTFTPANWQTPQTVTVSAAADADAVNGSAVMDVTATGWMRSLVTAIEDDPGAHNVRVSADTLNVPEGGSATFQVTLNGAPAAPVILTLDKGGDASVTATPTTLTFTDANWNVPQTVTVAAAEDPDAVHGLATIGYGVADWGYKFVAISAIDNDPLKVILDQPTVNILPGGTATVGVKLSAAPQGLVAVTLGKTGGSADIAVQGSPVYFTAGNWNDVQNVTLQASQTATGTATMSATCTGWDTATQTVSVVLSMQPLTAVSLTANPAPPRLPGTAVALCAAPTGGANPLYKFEYYALDGAWHLLCDYDVSATYNWTPVSPNPYKLRVTAKDTDGTTVVSSEVPYAVLGSMTCTPATVNVPEGSTATFQVALNYPPLYTTAIDVRRTSGDTGITSTPAALTFTTANWHTPQTVTLAAAEDADAEHGTATIQCSDLVWGTTDVTATEIDNEAANILTNHPSLQLSQGGSAGMSVKLSAPPTGPVTVTVAKSAGTADITVSGSPLTFTSDNWGTYQAVSIQASATATGTADVTCSAPGWNTTTIPVTMNPPLLTDLTLTCSPASPQPIGSTVTLTAIPVGGASLQYTFIYSVDNGTTWLTLRDYEAGSSFDWMPSSPGQYLLGAKAKDTDGTIRGSNNVIPYSITGTVICTPITLNVAEGSSATFQVKLSAKPLVDTTVTLARNVGGDDSLTVTPTVLTFTTANWDTLQTVTVNAANDVDATSGTASFTATASAGYLAGAVSVTEMDSEAMSIVVTPSAITVPELGTATVTVRLSAAPFDPVTVNVTRSSGDTDITVSGGATLTFTPANWHVAQTVTLSAAEDADGANDSATFQCSGGGLVATVTATEVDIHHNDVIVSFIDLWVPEGGSAFFQVSLGHAPATETKVTITKVSGDPDLNAQQTELIFNATNWRVPQPVTITAAEDVDAQPGEAKFLFSASGYTPADRNALEQDNDEQGFQVSVGEVIVPEGGSADITVRLTVKPLHPMMCTINRAGGDPDITVTHGTALNFTPDNWNVPQTVTLSAATDVDRTVGTTQFVIESPPEWVTANFVAKEDEWSSHAVKVIPSAVNVPEGGAATFQVVMASRPPLPVDVVVEPFDDPVPTDDFDPDIFVVSGAALTFTPDTWNIPQTVTLGDLEDPDASNTFTNVVCTGSNGTKATCKATEVDNDLQTFIINPAVLTVTENAVATFNVRPTVPLAGPLTVTVARVSGDTDISVISGGSLTFTPTNYQVAQTVTVRAVADPDVLHGTTVIRCAATGWVPAEIVVTEDDLDARRVVVTPTAVTVPEGASATFDVTLGYAPVAPVSVTIARVSGDTDITTGTTALIFMPENWHVPQTVTLTASEDLDGEDSPTAFACTASNGWSTATLTATEDDNDPKTFVLTPAAITVLENDVATFTVRPAVQVLSDVTVTVARVSGDVDLSVSSGGTLLFTPANWTVPQTVTVVAAADPDAMHSTAVIRCAAAGWISADMTASEDDVETHLVIANLSAVTIAEGGTEAFEITLGNPPPTPMTVTIARASGDTGITASPATLTFTDADWDVPQTVTLRAAEDLDGDNGVATFDCSANVTWTVATVTATEVDNDPLEFRLSAANVRVPQDGTNTFGVHLSVLPISDVTVTVARLSGADVTPESGATLTFTPADWNVDQTVTLRASATTIGTAAIQVSAPGWAPASLTAQVGLPPVITVFTPGGGNVVTATPLVRFKAVTEDGAACDFTVELQQGGTIRTMAVTHVTNDTETTLTLPLAQALTPGDWMLRVKAHSASGDTSTWTPTRFLTVPAGLPAVMSRGGLSLMSLPMLETALTRDDLSLSTAGISAWDPISQRYLTAADNPTLSTGQALWVRTPAPQAVTAVGHEVTTNHLLRLEAGWNLISSPFFTPVTWNTRTLRVKSGSSEKTLADAVTAGWLDDYAWGWEPSATNPDTGRYDLVYDSSIISGLTNRLQPWQGYWVHSYRVCDLILPAPTVSTASPAPAATRATRAAGSWHIRLTCVQGAEQQELLVGTTGTATAIGIGQPPVAPGAASLRFAAVQQSASLAVDLRSGLSPRQTWDMVVQADPASGAVMLQWPELTGLPANMALLLVDQQTGERRYLRTTRHYRVPVRDGVSAYHFQLIAEPRVASAPLIVRTALTREAATPALISFNATSATRATVAIRTLAGRLVRRMDLTTSASETRVRWDARDAQGRLVPAGAYLIEVTVSDADERTQRGVGRLTLPSQGGQQ